MCLKNLLSLIKAHTHAAQRQTEQTQFSAPSSERLFSPGFAAALLCAWNQDQFGFVSFFFFFFFFFYPSNVILADSLPHLLKKGQQGFWLYQQIAKCNFVQVLSWLYFSVWSFDPQQRHLSSILHYLTSSKYLAYIKKNRCILDAVFLSAETESTNAFKNLLVNLKSRRHPDSNDLVMHPCLEMDLHLKWFCILYWLKHHLRD